MQVDSKNVSLPTLFIDSALLSYQALPPSPQIVLSVTQEII